MTLPADHLQLIETPDFQKSTAPASLSLKGCPSDGIFSGRYSCAPENRDYEFRRRLAETPGTSGQVAPEMIFNV